MSEQKQPEGSSDGHSGAEGLASIRREIFENAALRQAVERAQHNAACLVPNPGNLGDGLIAWGAYDFFDTIGWSPKIVPAFRPDLLQNHRMAIIGGGGGWKEGLYEEHARALKPYFEAGGEAIVLPSSVDGFHEYFSRYAGQITIFARETVTLDRFSKFDALAGRVHLCPDMAFALDPAHFTDYVRRLASGTLYIHRTDGEAQDVVLPEGNLDLPILWNGHFWLDRASCEEPLRAAAHIISQFKTIDTDRLHMTILAAMTGRNVRMRANNYFKNRAVYNYSISKLRNVTFMQDTATDTDDDKNAKRAARVETDPSVTGKSPAETELVTLARLRREYFEPELLRLQKVIAELNKTKKEWFEPELDRRQQEINRLKQSLADPATVRGAGVLMRGTPNTDTHGDGSSSIDRAACQKEIQALRRRVMYYADNSRRLMDRTLENEQDSTRVAALEAEVERLREQAQNVLPVRMIRATIRELRRVASAVRRRLKR